MSDKGAVLVMDDEEMVRFIAGQTLKKCGFRVEFAEDGSEAVSMYREAMAAGTPFKAVILDLNIPGRMGGNEALGLLRALDPSVRAYVSSGNSSDPIMTDPVKHGFIGIVEKPYFYLDKALLAKFEQELTGSE